MRTYNEKIGDIIVKIINSYEPNGIGYNELVRQSGYAKNTITNWLDRLRNTKPEIVKKSPMIPIHLTEYAIKGIEIGNFAIPIDSRKEIKNNQKKLIERPSNNTKVAIALILCLASFGIYRYKEELGLGSIIHRDPIDQDKSYSYKAEKSNGISIDDITNKFVNIRNNQPDKKSSFPGKKINMINDELFGAIRLTKNSATKLIHDLVNYNPPILTSIENNNIDKITSIKVKYKVKDSLLEDFIQKCILAYNMDVSERLKFAYIYELLNKSYTKPFKKWMKKIYGNKRKLTELFDYMNYEKNQLKTKSPITISSQKKHYLKYIQTCDNDIFNYGLFDKDIKRDITNGKDEYKLNINKKYKTINHQYPFIIDILLDLLFPQFLRKIWYEQSDAKN